MTRRRALACPEYGARAEVPACAPRWRGVRNVMASSAAGLPAPPVACVMHARSVRTVDRCVGLFGFGLCEYYVYFRYVLYSATESLPDLLTTNTLNR